MRRFERMVVKGGTQRGRYRSKKYFGEVIRHEMSQLHITKDITLDRKDWRPRIRLEGL